MTDYQHALFIFRRDLRLVDNTGLNAALRQARRVSLAFVLDPRQIEPHRYQSKPGLQFMLESLQDLSRQIERQGGRLSLYQQLPTQVIESLAHEQAIDAVFVNGDYTPFSRQRDAELQACCQRLGLAFHSYGDALLNEPEQVLRDNGQPYHVFTAFYNRASRLPVAWPQALARQLDPPAASSDLAADEAVLRHLLTPHSSSELHGGSGQAQLQLAGLSQCQDYSRQRDFPAKAATSGLSAYLKFGCCSVREAYHSIVQNLGESHPLLRQLYWRDFFSHIAWYYPHVFGHAFHRRYDAIVWRNDLDHFQAWAQGRTGFPLVDAGMRELNQTGLMHNRVRMVVASFLVKDLHISWRWGERYFAQHLLDYDPCLNNGNWQWAASTGCDAQPYFRIFNPWLQQQKFDPDCLYIKRWVPELREIPNKILHHCQQVRLAADYPPPMVDHGLQSQHCKTLFQAINPTL